MAKKYQSLYERLLKDKNRAEEIKFSENIGKSPEV